MYGYGRRGQGHIVKRRQTEWVSRAEKRYRHKKTGKVCNEARLCLCGRNTRRSSYIFVGSYEAIRPRFQRVILQHIYIPRSLRFSFSSIFLRFSFPPFPCLTPDRLATSQPLRSHRATITRSLHFPFMLPISSTNHTRAYITPSPPFEKCMINF